MPVTSENQIDSDGNLQSHSKLKNPHPEIGINGNAIKWRWPRITKAGVLIGIPIPIGAGFKIVLDRRFRPQNKKYFFNNKDKIVLLRQRSLLDAPKTSIEFQITSALYDRPGEIGDIIFIVPRNPGGSSSFNPNDFRDGILFAPIPDQRDDPNDPPYKELVHKAIVKHINTHKGPLNAPRNNTTRDCLIAIQAKRPKGISIQKPKNIPALSRPPSRNLPRIVGLYEGGHGYYCNLYHPSGYCIMRASQDISNFCHVCCYVLVDKLDPSLHVEVDKQYGAYYPKPR